MYTVFSERAQNRWRAYERRRLELHLFQSDLAKMFGADKASVRNWEKNTYRPAERHMPAIVKWFGYDPREAVYHLAID